MSELSLSAAVGSRGWKTRRLCGYGLAAVVVLAAVLRIAGMFDDFWLDEVWSLAIAGQLSSAAQVFTKACVDNSHPLNTLLMYLIGEHPYWPVYRIHSVLAGAGSVVLAGLILWRRGPVAGLLAALLMGVSYLMVAFSVEARGYAMMIFFALLGLYALQRSLDASLGQSPGFWTVLVFWLAVVLGFLSNLMFMHFYLGASAWSAWRLGRQAMSGSSGQAAEVGLRHRWGCAVARLAWLHGVPVLFLGVFFAGYVRRIAFNDAPMNPLGQVLLQWVGWLTGVPQGSPVAVGVAVAALAAMAFAWALWRLGRSGSDEWVLFLVTVLLAPAAVTAVEILVLHHTEIFVRYFLISAAFLLLLLAGLLGEGLARGGTAATVALLALAALCAGNLVEIWRFETAGRGQYQQAWMYMVQHSRSRMVSVASDHDFRTSMLLGFYCQDLIDTGRLPPDVRLDYRLTDLLGVKDPQWFLLTADDLSPSPSPGVVLRDGRLYAFERAFPHYGVSGWGWWLYQDVRQP